VAGRATAVGYDRVVSRNDVQGFVSAGHPVHVVGCRGCSPTGCLVGLAGHVRREYHIVHGQQRIVEGNRFHGEDVQAGAGVWCERSASTSAVWSTIWPRATLTRTAPGFIFPSSAGPIMCRVSGVSGTWTETMSAADSRSSSFSGPPRTSTPSRAASSAAGHAGFIPTTCRPSGRVSRASSRPDQSQRAAAKLTTEGAAENPGPRVSPAFEKPLTAHSIVANSRRPAGRSGTG
jgi:hypothetical protein